MSQLPGTILIEIVDCDVITWQIRCDERRDMTFSIDTSDVPGVVVADEEGTFAPRRLVHAKEKTMLEVSKRTPLFTMLYRRNNVIVDKDGALYYLDSWRFDYQRLIIVRFPYQATFDELLPPAFQRNLGDWNGHPLVRTITRGVLIEGRYKIDPALYKSVSWPQAARPTMEEVAAHMGIELDMIHKLRQYIAADPAAVNLLAGSTWLAPLIHPAKDL